MMMTVSSLCNDHQLCDQAVTIMLYIAVIISYTAVRISYRSYHLDRTSVQLCLVYTLLYTLLRTLTLALAFIEAALRTTHTARCALIASAFTDQVGSDLPLSPYPRYSLTASIATLSSFSLLLYTRTHHL